MSIHASEAGKLSKTRSGQIHCTCVSVCVHMYSSIDLQSQYSIHVYAIARLLGPGLLVSVPRETTHVRPYRISLPALIIQHW